MALGLEHDMAGKHVDTSVWNLTLVAALGACGPIIPEDDGGDGSIDDSGDDGESGDDDGTTTIDPPCTGDDCPECDGDEDCPSPSYCVAGRCEYYYCGLAEGGDDVFRCSPWYECWGDSDCDEGEICVNDYCYEDPCRGQELDAPIPLAIDIPVVDLVFADLDGQPSQELVAVGPTGVRVLSTSAETIALDVGMAMTTAATGDIDLDGDVDVVLGEPGQLLLLVNDGLGGLTVSEPIATLGTPREIVLADWVNPARLDAFVRTDDAILRHTDLGEASPLVETAAGAFTVHGFAIIYADTQTWLQWLSGDELLPPEPFAPQPASALVSTEPMPGFERVFGSIVADGTTEVSVWTEYGGSGIGNVLNGEYRLLAAFDMQGDGGRDAVIANATGELTVLPYMPDKGTDFGCISTTTAPHGITVIAGGDFEGAASHEVAVSDGTQISLFQNVPLFE